MAKSKVERTRLTLDLAESDMNRVKKLEEIYDVNSQTEAVRIAIRHNLALVELIKSGDKIQCLKKDGTNETIVFIEWMSLYEKDTV